MNFDLDTDDPAIEIQEATFGLSKIQQAELEFKRYESVLVEMAAKAGTHLIVDAKTNEEAVVLAGQSKSMFRTIEKKRKEVIGPASEFVAHVNQLVKPLTGILTGIENGLKQRITRYAQEQERERLERQRKANEEAAKLQAEIDKAAKDANEQSVVVVSPVVVEQPKVTRTASGSASLRTTWTFKVTDFALLPDKFKQVDKVAINAEVKAGIREIPGVRIFEEQSTTIRAASIPKWDSLEQF